MSMTNQRKVRVYIDGFNLYHAIDAVCNPNLKWINYHKLSQSLLRSGEILDEVNFFTAVLRWNRDKQARHESFIAAQKAVGVRVHESNFKKSTKYCKNEDQWCDFHEEKQTDVAIAVKLVSDAMLAKFDRAILITADSDQIPAAKFVKESLNLELSLIYPPGRKQQARDLGNVVRDRAELTKGHIGTCLLPRTVLNTKGVAVAQRPAPYA
jgi:uncharacterized LabA/DUF88 family protein